jgi:16S rRNA (guanine(527)-N(7))-methyltransferase RsmG
MNANSLCPMPGFPGKNSMRKDLIELGLPSEEEVLNGMILFSRILMNRSRYANLIGPRERSRLWSRHILESAFYSRLLNRGSVVVDIGSGNGFPGIILAILGFEVLLLEPRRKRYLFLRHAVKELNISNCEIRQERLEEMGHTSNTLQFTARAVAPAAELVHTISGVAGNGSILVCGQTGLSDDTAMVSAVEFISPPLDRGGFLVQYRV